jgi:hypothetical protein
VRVGEHRNPRILAFENSFALALVEWSELCGLLLFSESEKHLSVAALELRFNVELDGSLTKHLGLLFSLDGNLSFFGQLIRQRLVWFCHQAVESELKLPNQSSFPYVTLLIKFVGIVHLSQKFLVFFKEESGLDCSDKLRIQIIFDDFCLAHFSAFRPIFVESPEQNERI